MCIRDRILACTETGELGEDKLIMRGFDDQRILSLIHILPGAKILSVEADRKYELTASAGTVLTIETQQSTDRCV